MKISLVIPAYNEEKYISTCLESVVKNGGGLYEIIVVNNASTDKTPEIATGFSEVRVVTESKKGITRARQRGIQESSGDIIAFIDADTRMPEGWLQKIQKEFSTNPKLVSLSGPYDYYDLSGFSRFSARFYWLCIAVPVYYFVGYMLLGGNFAVKKSALLKIGGFDTGIEFYGEDTDLARRLSRIGKVKWRNNFFIWTSGRRIMGEGILRTAYLYTINFIWEVIFKKPFTKNNKDIR